MMSTCRQSHTSREKDAGKVFRCALLDYKPQADGMLGYPSGRAASLAGCGCYLCLLWNRSRSVECERARVSLLIRLRFIFISLICVSLRIKDISPARTDVALHVPLRWHDFQTGWWNVRRCMDSDRSSCRSDPVCNHTIYTWPYISTDGFEASCLRLTTITGRITRDAHPTLTLKIWWNAGDNQIL